MTKAALIAAGALLFLCTAAWAQSSSPAGEAGELAFNNACRTCHSVKEGDNRLGPSLYRVIGRKAGSLPGYAYSDSMKHADIAWDEATLDRFMANPDAVVANNKMKPFGGMASAEERGKIIAYLKTRS